MIDLIILFFLCRNIGNLAISKGLKPFQWKMITVFAWLFFEIVGLTFGIMIFGFSKDNMFGLLLFAVACAFGGYLLVKYILENKPDPEDIDNIGSDSIRP
jgi:hypothetical protein